MLLDDRLTVEQVFEVAVGRRPVVLADAARERIRIAREATERLLAENRPVYGLTTGVGAMKRVSVSAGEQGGFNRLLLLSHRIGTGPDVPAEVVRAACLAQIAGFAHGYSGIRESSADLLCAALNSDLAPRARTTGSLGQSDLGPLADIAAALTGEGEWAAELDRLGLEAWRPDSKEALAFVNSNAFSLGWASLAVAGVEALLDAFDKAAALTFEGMLGNVQALDPAVAAARPVDGIGETIERLQAMIHGGTLVHGDLHRELQDPLTMRVVPQTHGAARVALRHARAVIEQELVASHDNPAITPDGRSLSNGNFDSVPYGVVLDYLRIAVAHVATASCERSQKLAHSAFSGLPTGLRSDDGSSGDGLAIVVYGAAAAAAEVRMLAAPATLESPTTSIAEGIEDRIIPTPVAARRLAEQTSLSFFIAATELYAAAQAIDLRDRVADLGDGTGAAYAMVREVFPRHVDGEPPASDLTPLVDVLTS